MVGKSSREGLGCEIGESEMEFLGLRVQRWLTNPHSRELRYVSDSREREREREVQVVTRETFDRVSDKAICRLRKRE